MHPDTSLRVRSSTRVKQQACAARLARFRSTSETVYAPLRRPEVASSRRCVQSSKTGVPPRRSQSRRVAPRLSQPPLQACSAASPVCPQAHLHVSVRVGARARAACTRHCAKVAVSARTRQRCGRRTLLRLPPRLPRVPGGTLRVLEPWNTRKRCRVLASRVPERFQKPLGAVSAHHSQHGVLTLKSPRRCRSTPGALWQKRALQIAAFLWRARARCASTASPCSSAPSSLRSQALHRTQGRL